MTINQTIHATVDRVLAQAIRRSNDKIPCAKGCFHCCREPVYASLSEVRELLSTLDAEQLARTTEKTRAWLQAFLSSGLQRDAMPNAFAYREFRLWCPLLKDTLCSVYERRPLSCRYHVARKTADGCIDDELRKHQEFLLIPKLDEGFCMQRLAAMKPGETESMDHLGLLLAKELLGEDHVGESRIDLACDGNGVMVSRREKETA